jgi:hypothetical protein
MRTRTLAVVVGLSLGLPLVAQAPKVAKATQVELTSEFTVEAPASRVWQELISASGFGALTGFRPEKPDAPLGKIGESVRASVWEDKGLLIVTGAEAQKELRVSWEPDNGSYLCQKRVRLQSAGNGTRVLYQDRYTDTQPAASVDQTAQQVAKETETHIREFTERFKK